MADESIRKDFVEGVYEIFSTLFNDGVNDGINLYRMSENSKPNVYGECKCKTYKKPILMVAKAIVSPSHDDETVLGFSENATFTIPVKSFQCNNLGVSKKELSEYMRSVIEFKGVYYTVEKITPKAYIEDTFLMYDFLCKELKDYESIEVEEVEEEYYVEGVTLVLNGKNLNVSNGLLTIDFSDCSVKNYICYFGEPTSDNKIEINEDVAVLSGDLSINNGTLTINFSDCTVGNNTCYFNVSSVVDNGVAVINGEEKVLNKALVLNGKVENKTLIL